MEVHSLQVNRVCGLQVDGYKRYEKVNKKIVNSLGSLAEGIEDLRVDVFQVSPILYSKRI